ncbi:hypothetical protein ALP36_00093 [Pseudomonas syringae pv. coriandricola]|uniref:Uncharacterized protein n=4 Tax=Pseudomonas syringae group TaxID=136849 RepID=A0A3M3R8Q8_9PSED|nr:Uncharacterized protein AC506_3148 [Pseudomonas syringae pv. maculicola str. M6]KPB84702.1 Uncharacterized protein AC505_1894 [Pseudomonas syringae pv. maculicola]RML51275.1 hypothetical protein ALQ94_05250 [Pseudomonas amygdali pv. morsprunorum]RMN92852.1 hypothetical protein ALQ49_00899 [Pseudomonas syringae pv. apii]RMT72608.1 hypothetical protein ALP44_05596 [Pseudomonas syringae pv. theae]RMU10210.1 hypothetical protein ALP36_00093 [Pseudomonas syringae pv. coriandricola]
MTAGFFPQGGSMNTKLQEWLHDLGVALGLIERPKLQPIPVRADDNRRRQRR